VDTAFASAPAARRIVSSQLSYDLYADAVFARRPGYRDLTLDLLRPLGDALPPVVVWIHGGSYISGTHRALPDPLRPSRLDERLVGAGFAVARVSYRFSAEARFPAQLLDVRAAIRWLRRHAVALRLDGSKIGVWGESAGGHLAALACLAPDGLFLDADVDGDVTADVTADVQAGVIWYAPSDFLTLQEQNRADSQIDHNAADAPGGLLLGAPITTVRDDARAASSVTYAHPGAPAMLLAHGRIDGVVPVGQSEELHEALLARGADSSLTIVEGADHCFIGADLDPLVAQAVAFFRQKLRSNAESR
jgi:acetyl esterase/lipase